MFTTLVKSKDDFAVESSLRASIESCSDRGTFATATTTVAVTTNARETDRTRKKPSNIAWEGQPDIDEPGLPIEIRDKVARYWPIGWTEKIKTRQGGASVGGHDQYWCSPNNNVFRSIVTLRVYLEALVKKNGDEEMAYDVAMSSKRKKGAGRVKKKQTGKSSYS
jgi:hypothetical protein